MSNYLKRFIIKIGMLYQDPLMELEYRTSVRKYQRPHIFFLSCVTLFMAFVLLVNFFLENFPDSELYPRIALFSVGVVNILVYKFRSSYDEFSMVIFLSFGIVYIFQGYEMLYDTKMTLFAVGNSFGVLEIIAVVICRSNLSRCYILMLSLILRVVYANIVNSYSASVLSFAFWYMYENFNRKNFKHMVESRDKAMNYQKLISNDFPLNFIIVSKNLKRVLYENEQSKKTKAALFPSNGFLTGLNWLNPKVKVGDGLVYLEDFLDFLRKKADSREIEDDQTLFCNENCSHTFDIRAIDMSWEGLDSYGLIISDITEKQKLEIFKKVNEYKDLVIAAVSHELRTPLNGILGMLKIVIEKVHDRELHIYLENCNICAKLLLHFVNSILDSSQIGAQKIKLNKERVSIRELCNELRAIYKFQAFYKNIKFEIRTDNKIPKSIFTDKYRLLQVLINLIGNAFKFTCKGSVTLDIRLGAEERIMNFSVIDTGIGIKEQDLKSLFTNFGKLDQTDKNINARGVGLGLSISNEIVKVLNENKQERITVTSVLNQGSNFSFKIFLPELAVVSHDDIDSESMIEVNTIETYEFSLNPNFDLLRKSSVLTSVRGANNSFLIPAKKRCLVVDDNSYNLFAISHILTSLKLDIVTALSGEEALELVETNRFDLIFMDIQMPVMDGVETTQKLNEKFDKMEIKPVPIVALTANGEGNKQAYIKAGMADMLTKPVKQDEIQSIIEKYLS